MHKHHLFFIIVLLITTHTFTMDQLNQQNKNSTNTPYRPVPSLLTLSTKAIAYGYGKTNFDRYKNSAKFIMTLDENRKNETLPFDDSIVNDCINEYTKRCWTIDTDDGLDCIRTDKGNVIHKLNFTSSFQEHKFTPLLIKNKHAKNTYITAKDNEICIIDMQSQQIQKKLIGHTDPLKCCITTYDDEIIISGALDETIKIWNVNSDQPIQTLPNNATPRNLAANKEFFCSLDWKNPTLTMWDLTACKKIISKKIGYLCDVHPISLLIKDNTIYVGMEKTGAQIIAIDLRSGKTIDAWHAHNNRITSIIPCNRDTHSLYSTSFDGAITHWDVRKFGHRVKRMDICHAEDAHGKFSLEGIHQTKDGKQLFVTESNNIFICDITPCKFYLRSTLPLDYKVWLISPYMAMNDEETELYIPTHYKGIITVTPNYVVEEFNTVVKNLVPTNCAVPTTENR